jgi:GTP-binding protein
LVTLVGRPNVGKSSLFNCLLGRKKALVQDTPGVTRDRNYAICSIGGREIMLCDTGGFEDQGEVAGELMAGLIRDQALVAMQESDVLVFVMDIRAGLTPGDEHLGGLLRTSKKPVLWVLNKADHPSVTPEMYDFYRLGVPDLMLVSAEHSLGLDDLGEAIHSALPPERAGETDPSDPERAEVPEWEDGRSRRSRKSSAERRGGKKRRDTAGRLQFMGDDMPSMATTRRGPAPRAWDGADPTPEEYGGLIPGMTIDEDGLDGVEFGSEAWGDALQVGETPVELPAEFIPPDTDSFVPRVAILGRPNVGKSTLLNRLLGYQRSITSPIAGTTHDIVDSYVEHQGRAWILIDTAGIRRKAKVHERLEKLTVGRAIRVIEAAHICLLLVDGAEGVTEQEAKIGALIAERGRALVLVVNKWDLAEKGDGPRRAFMDRMRVRFPHLGFADSLFVSALTGKGTHRIWKVVERADDSHRATVRTAPFNRWLRGVVTATPPPMEHHHPIRFYYGVQTGIRPPTFAIFCSKPNALKPPYRRFLTSRAHAEFGGPGSPVRLVFRDRSGS